MPAIHYLLSRLGEERLILVLLLALPALLFARPASAEELGALIDWQTLGALASLMVLSRGLEDSGYLTSWGQALLARARTPRRLAAGLVLFAALLSCIITNDVALFVVVPLTLGLGRSHALPVGRLVIFEALAVNAGSALSPLGNPQNLYLWQSSGVSFVEFFLAMLPLGAGLLALVLALIPIGFRGQELPVEPPAADHRHDRPLLTTSLTLYLPFLLLAERGFAVFAALALVALYGVRFRAVLRHVDWPLLLLFLLMFVDLGLLAELPGMSAAAESLQTVPGGLITSAALLSQLLSNVPATLLLDTFTDSWRELAWGVSIGGFGAALGSLANLIALRMARQPRLWREFHLWSIPVFGAGLLFSLLYASAGPGL